MRFSHIKARSHRSGKSHLSGEAFLPLFKNGIVYQAMTKKNVKFWTDI